MSLRTRLLVGLVLLLTLGLSVAAVATYEEERSFLLTRVDQQVRASILPVSARLGVLNSLRPSPRPLFPDPLGPRRLHDRGPATFQAAGTYGELLGAGGRVLGIESFTFGQRAASPPALPAELPISRLDPMGTRLFTVDSKAGGSLRYRAAAYQLSRGRRLVVAVPLREVDQALHRLIVVELLFGGGVTLALVLLGWVVIRLGLRPLARMGQVADEIAHGNLSRRVTPANRRTEVGRLGLSLNEMLVQIEQAFADRRESEDRLRRFLADASHELRTPLAAIRGYAEVFRLGAAADPAELERSMRRIEAEAARMGVLVEDLLLLASLDELPEMQLEPVDVSELAAHAAQDTRAMAPAREVRLRAEQTVLVQADPEQLRQVLANLTRNAVIHTPADTPIDIAVTLDGPHGVVEVRDHGPGLPPSVDDRVFERFWRTEGGRARGRGGAGLGLAIVKAIVHAHHGDVSARNAPEGGAIFRVSLPLAPGPSEADFPADSQAWLGENSDAGVSLRAR